MSIYSAKLAHELVVINCRYSNAQMCTREDTLTRILGTPYWWCLVITRSQQKFVEKTGNEIYILFPSFHFFDFRLTFTPFWMAMVGLPGSWWIWSWCKTGSHPFFSCPMSDLCTTCSWLLPASKNPPNFLFHLCRAQLWGNFRSSPGMISRMPHA